MAPHDHTRKGNMIRGRKRHILVDGHGLVLIVSVTPADGQGRDGAIPLIHGAPSAFPMIQIILVDGAYGG